MYVLEIYEERVDQSFWKFSYKGNLAGDVFIILSLFTYFDYLGE